MEINIKEKKEEILETIRKIAEPTLLEGITEKYDDHFKGFGDKADAKKVYSFIFDVLYDNKLVSAVDWKWSIQDELVAIKNRIPEFDYEMSDLTETDDFTISCTLKVADEEYDLSDCNEYEFLDEVNDILKDLNSDTRILVIEGNTGDTLFYCFVSKNNYHGLSNSEFLPFVYS